jgi:PAS domain-containing protein
VIAKAIAAARRSGTTMAPPCDGVPAASGGPLRLCVRSVIALAPVLVLALVQAQVPAASARTSSPGGMACAAGTSSAPSPAACVDRSGIARGTSPEDTAKALFERARSHLGAGRFDEAGRALDCADAVLGTDGDADLRYELVRQRGILDYRRERIPEALSRFECALQLSTAQEDRDAIARDLKNVGTALRRLGDFRGALRSLTLSLDMQRAGGDVGGAVLNNIADVYRELDEPAQAMRYYREALAAFRAHGETMEAAHVLESMATAALDAGDVVQAQRWLDDALRTYRDGGHRAYELRVYAGLTRAALARGDVAGARRQVASALAISGEHGLPLPTMLQLQVARTERLSGDTVAAAARIRAALAATAAEDADRAALIEELAAVQERAGDRAAAIETLRRANAEALSLERARYDRQLGWLRTRFETAERDRTIATLETENRLRRAELRQRTLLLWLVVAGVFVLGLTAWILLQRRRQRERLEEAARRVRHEEELARYRREADALVEDRKLLQGLLDSREDAVCLLDAEGQLLAANRAACRLLDADDGHAVGHAFSDFLAAGEEEPIAAALERMEDAAVHDIGVAARGGTRLVARLTPWERGDGLIVLSLRVADAESPAPVDADAGDPSRMREEFRRTLVELMLAVVETWERETGTSRLELAEQSRIWRITIDDGRLRARAMERYLSISKMPQNPRWRDVLRSAYYVLGHCAMSSEVRDGLQRRVDAALTYTRRSALV